MVNQITLAAVLGVGVFALGYAVSWPVSYAAMLGAASIGFVAVGQLFHGIDTEKVTDFELPPATGLRPAIATTAGAFRASELSDVTARRLGLVLADFCHRHRVTLTEAQQLFGPDLTEARFLALCSGTTHPTPMQAHQILRIIRDKDQM